MKGLGRVPVASVNTFIVIFRRYRGFIDTSVQYIGNRGITCDGIREHHGEKIK